jgi:tricorn protease
MQGYETDARVSPDGQWVAFTGRQFGNPDVYVVPINGGEIRQLTWYSGDDEVSAWSWDSKEIYFTSLRMGQPSGFRVARSGGTAERVFPPSFFNYDHNLVPHPDGSIFFSDSYESDWQKQRKRYRGPLNPEIQSYAPASKKFTKYTSWEGKDFDHTIDRKGNVYYISDEGNGEFNLYTIAGGKPTALTNFSTSIRTPQVNAEGGKLVFEKDYQLWIYDLAAKKASKLSLSLVRNSVLAQEKDFDVRGRITAFDISPDGKKLAFISRGELFVSDAEGKFIQQVSKGSAERAVEVKWMADNATLLFNQTKNGYLNWYTIPATGGPVKELTDEAENNRLVSFNSKRTQAVYLSGRNEVRTMDLKTLKSKTIAKAELWGFYNSAPSFSPNEEYVVFNGYRNFEQEVLVHNLKTGQTMNLTNSDVSESGPLWSPDGKFLFFSSNRLKPSYPTGAPTHVYRMPLEKMDEPYRYDKYSALFTTEQPADTSKKKDSAKTKIPAPQTSTAVTIDPVRIMERLELVGPQFGEQDLLAVTYKNDKTTVYYLSNHGEGRNAVWKTVLEPFEEAKTTRITGIDNAFNVSVVEAGDKVFALASGNIFKINPDANTATLLSTTGYTFRRNLREEFEQVFDEAWAAVSTNYYDEAFHGIDWKKMKARYRAFLPYVNNRQDLRTLLEDMLGELNSSHQGFYSFGEEESVQMQNRTMETGILFDNNDPFKVASVLRRSNADRKGVNIQPGDVLVKVNDRAIDPKMDRYYYFTRPSIDRELRLTFRRGTENVEVKIHPQSSLAGNLYQEWCDGNQKRVEEKSKNRIAYTHMRDMQGGELEKFLLEMTQELNDKDGLILDLRFNNGGNVHDEVLRFLSQRSYLQWKYREGDFTKQSNFAPSDKPIVLLINEQSLSDAEMTAQGFKTLKLGTIVGNETYRWIIFTSGTGFVDGSFVRLPSWGCYSLDGKDLEKTGVSPDIKVINTFEDRISGRDPQLDRAIAEVLKGK